LNITKKRGVRLEVARRLSRFNDAQIGAFAEALTDALSSGLPPDLASRRKAIRQALDVAAATQESDE
jgi:hypothetical protein